MIQLQLSKQTEERFKEVMSLHANKDALFNNIIDFQIKELKLGIYNIQKDLSQFEEKHKMKTNLFYEKFEAGKIGDDDDYMIWSGIYEMLLRDKQKLEKIKW